MKIRIQYIILIVLLHLTTLVLSFLIFEENKIFFIASEIVVLTSLGFSIRLYQSLLRPLQMLLTGAEAIKDKDFTIKFIKTGKFEMDQLIEVYNKMIDELRRERQQQREQHYFLDNIIKQSPIGILILDFDGKIESINPRALQMFRMDKEILRGKTLKNVDHPIARQGVAVPVNSSRVITINGMQSYKCQKSAFLDRGFSRQFLMIEELTEEILKTEKQAYGKVIRMMAHEVNNSIGPINAILESFLFYGKQLQPEDQKDFLSAINVARQRNQRLNVFMKNFAEIVRMPQPHKEQKNINSLLESMGKFMELEARRRNIELVLKLPDTKVYHFIDSYQIEQVLLNVLRNAIEAIEKEGKIAISLDVFPKKITIKNNGKPISEGNSTKLFTPFFSTKKEGQGIGLTLAREILHNHGFSFSLATKPDGWTYFEILLK